MEGMGEVEQRYSEEMKEQAIRYDQAQERPYRSYHAAIRGQSRQVGQPQNNQTPSR